MRGPGSKSTTSPEPNGANDDRFSYRLTPAGRRALAQLGGAAERRLRRAAWRRAARQRGIRCGTICGRWRGTRHVPELRLSGVWLQAAGFGLGCEYEVTVEKGRLVVEAQQGAQRPARDLPKPPDLKELAQRNPQIDLRQIEEARATIRELRKQGVARAEYSLVEPHSRPVPRTSKRENPPEDPRMIRLNSLR